MGKRLRIVVSARGRRHIAAGAQWWREHREATEVFADEIERIAGLLQIHPYLGAVAENARTPGVRRFYLERIDFHLFYRVEEDKARIVVLALWHARRRPGRW